MLLELKNLKVNIHSPRGTLPVVGGVSLSLDKGEIHSIVGESGCGKTVTSLAIARLLPSNITSYEGEVLFNGNNLLVVDDNRIRSLRGREIAYIFQDPFTALNPLKKIREQIIEPYLVHFGDKAKEAGEKARHLLNQVGVTDIEERMNSYPSQMSGGILQRISIAMALMCDPLLLIADEPTSAIDVTIQAQFIELLLRLKQENGMAILFISHDMGLVSHISDTISVMYAGYIAETGKTEEIIASPLHPYTRALIASLPSVAENKKLQVIPGMVPSPGAFPKGCHFSNRCPDVMDICQQEKPAVWSNSASHKIMCVRGK